MRKAFLAIFTLVITTISCEKKETTTTPPAEKYMTMIAGSMWNYEITNNKTIPATTTPYTVTATSTDTTVTGGRVYKIFENSTGIHEYYNLTGSDYYSYVSFPPSLGLGDLRFENLYFKDNLVVGATWNMTVNIPYSFTTIPVKITNNIEAKGLTRTVNGIVYNDVVQVKTNLSSTLIPASSITSDINNYYAPKYGLIESTYQVSLNYLGISESVDTKTVLKSANF